MISAAGAAVVIALCAGGCWLMRQTQAPVASGTRSEPAPGVGAPTDQPLAAAFGGRPAIAVLPFGNFSGDAALQLQEQLRGQADRLRPQIGLSFSARIGLNSGEVVGRIGDDLRMDYTAQRVCRRFSFTHGADL